MSFDVRSQTHGGPSKKMKYCDSEEESFHVRQMAGVDVPKAPCRNI